MLKITLVPGTWAYGVFARDVSRVAPRKVPRWFEAGSGFRKKLEAELAESGVDFQIEVLIWSGANSVREREIQATRLAETLAKQRGEGVRRVVIAHSHGGNIACKAAALAEVRDNDLSVVTLASPFLQARTRDEDSPKLILQVCHIILGALCAMAFMIASGEYHGMAGVKKLGLGLLLALPFVVVRLWYDLHTDEKVADRINFGTVAVRLLVVRGFSDEASGAITVGSIGTGLVNTMLYVVAFPLRFLIDRFWGIWLMIIVATVTPGLLWVERTEVGKMLSIWSVIATLAIFSVVPIWVAGLFSTVFGRELFFECLNIALTVDSVPDACSTVDVVTLSASQTSAKGLRHGLYAHPFCTRLIAYWLATGSTKVPPPTR